MGRKRRRDDRRLRRARTCRARLWGVYSAAATSSSSSEARVLYTPLAHLRYTPDLLTPVSFRLMLFAPFVGEVIVGKVLACTPNYISITLGFFEDIYVPPTLLPPNSM